MSAPTTTRQRGRSLANYCVYRRTVDGVELFDCIGPCGREIQAQRPDGDGLVDVPQHEAFGRCGACAQRHRRGQTGPPRVSRLALALVSALAEPLGEWVKRAACRDADPDDFALPDAWSRSEPPRPAVLAARRYCARCPVLDECRQWAEANSDGQPQGYRITGLWGGQWRSPKAVKDVPMSDPKRRRPRRLTAA